VSSPKSAVRLRLKAGCALVVAATALAMPVSAHADDLWIAVAVSQSSGESDTHTLGAQPLSLATAAMQDCNRIGHVADCQPLPVGQGGCVATATPGIPYSIRGAWALSREAAIEMAAAKATPGSRVAADCVGDPGLQGR
jgi:hypothetical protein